MFHLTHIGYLEIVQVLLVKLIDCFQKQWWKVPKVIKGNYSLFHLNRVFMVELFDVANGKMFQMGILNFGGMLASKTKQTNKKQQIPKTTKRGWGGENKVQM